jgi:hypothetical protein
MEVKDEDEEVDEVQKDVEKSVGTVGDIITSYSVLELY